MSAFDLSSASIEAIALDVDGVLTDGTVLWSESGEESKRFSFEDIMGLSRARQAGLHLGLISGENSILVDRYADKLKIPFVEKGCQDKGAALLRFGESCGIAMRHVAFMGDDVNDLPAFAVAGLRVAPANAQLRVKASADIVLDRKGGDGAVRQLIEMILVLRAS